MAKCRIGLVLVGILAVFFCNAAGAAPPPDTATCSITVTVADIMEWEANFPPIALADITSQGASVTGSATITLYTNGDVDISADNTTAAQLTGPASDTLVTEYALAYDGDGVTNTGGLAVLWTLYSSFLGVASRVTHVPGDGAVDVTLSVRASNAGGTLANAGAYAATQTLTATWAS
jgi:hypothetical protein